MLTPSPPTTKHLPGKGGSRNANINARRKVTLTLPISLIESTRRRAGKNFSAVVEEALREANHRWASVQLLKMVGQPEFLEWDWKKDRDDEWQSEKTKMKKWGWLPPDWEERID